LLRPILAHADCQRGWEALDGAALRSVAGLRLIYHADTNIDNTRADKLDSFMWRYSFQERRCLIPGTEVAEAEGERGSKTRTWSRCRMSRCLPSPASGVTPTSGDILFDGDDRSLHPRR
jgi:hypothetical protein